MSRPRRTPAAATPHLAETYTHYDADAVARPEVGIQAQFRKKKPAKKYRYDPSLDPELAWNEAPVDAEVARLWDQAVNATTLDEAKAALRQLNQLAAPSLRWAGKAERPEFSVPTLPLFVHERLSTKAILETLQGHRRDQQMALDLFGDQQLPLTDRVLKAYEHKDRWVNRLILGDSLQVMNSLLEYESLGGQVQMIYMDPPYGVKFGSNFQPFVRKRDVKNNDDGDMTREPEMVQAYRDTWEMGLHSYLTYMKDRLMVARELLSESGSVFVQISDDNIHLVRQVLDEVFGASNFVVTIVVKKTGSQRGSMLEPVADYLLWYCKDIERGRAKYRQLFAAAGPEDMEGSDYRYVELPDGRDTTLAELSKETGKGYSQDRPALERDYPGAKLFAADPLTSGGFRKNQSVIFRFRGMDFDPGIAKGNCWKHTAQPVSGEMSGMERLAAAGRLYVGRQQLRFKSYESDFPFKGLTNIWDGIGGPSNPLYVVQTNSEIVRRCILMTTEPGDLVLDPTCGSGTTAHAAEEWGRRWITIDASRVPLALTRQRLLTATYAYMRLTDPGRGVSGGFEYRDHRASGNRKKDGYGLASHITSSTIANDEPPDTEVLVDRPERDYSITRVTGPFVVEATIPTPVDLDGDGFDDAAPEDGSDAAAEAEDYFNRMFETLRRVRRVKLPGGAEVEFGDVRIPASRLALSAEATVEDAPVGIVFGPESGAISERLVAAAAREAYQRAYVDLYVFGFAIEPNARLLIENSEQVNGIHANYVAVTPDVAMGDLLKNQRASQVFSVAGLPDVRLLKLDDGRFRVELLGLDTFDPATMETDSMAGAEVPAWFLDANFNASGAFIVDQAFFPRTSAWDSLKKELRGTLDDSVWDALSGTVSEPFAAPDTGQVAVKVIDDRGNELVVVKSLTEAVSG